MRYHVAPFSDVRRAITDTVLSLYQHHTAGMFDMLENSQ